MPMVTENTVYSEFSILFLYCRSDFLVLKAHTMLGQDDPEAVLIYARLPAVPGGDKDDLTTCTAVLLISSLPPHPYFLLCRAVSASWVVHNGQLLSGFKPKYHHQYWAVIVTYNEL